MPDIRERVIAALGDAFELGDELGRGGMAIVYRATDRRLRRAVAIKVLPPELAFNQDVRTRFLREAQTSAGLTHPNIVPIFTVDERDHVVFFVMGLVEGESLAARLRRQRRLDADASRRILSDVAEALAYAHAHGVVHRDIKPDNILLAGDGRILVSDFGIARAAAEDSRLTVTGIAVGTPAYMSPEQAMGEREVDGRSDIYSLGVVGYQMLCGEPPFAASNTPAMLMKHMVEPPRPLRERAPDVPPALAAAIHHALEKRPEDRWRDASAFRDALRGGGQAAPARGAPRAPRPAVEEQWWPAAPVLPAPGRLPRRFDAPRGANAAVDEALISERIGEFRRRFFGLAALMGFLVFINAATGTFPWSIFPAIGIGGGLMRRWSPLGRLGLRFWDVVLEGEDAIVLARNRRDGSRIHRLVDGFRRRLKLSAIYGVLSAAIFAVGSTFNYDPLIPVFVVSAFGASVSVLGALVNAVRLKRSGVDLGEMISSIGEPSEIVPGAPEPASRLGPPPVAGEADRLAGKDVADGPYGDSVRRAIEARRASVEIIAGLGAPEREVIPDVLPTVESLLQRVVALSRTAHRLRADATPEALARLEARLDALGNGDGSATDQERTRTLLRRQKESLTDLVRRREQLETQVESAVLMLENLRLDLAKLRSSGLASAADDVTSATQEARALSKELEYALAGIREARQP